MAAPPSALLLLTAAAAASANTFIPFLGRGTAQPSQPPTSQPPAPRRRLSDDDIKQLLRGRDALVLAASDTALGLSVAEGLTDVGARVILVCREPKRVQRACDRMTARCRTGGDYRSNAVAPPGCEARALDLSDAGAVWRFAEQLEREERPLHVLVNCADDACPLHSRNGHSGWERTAGSNHLGPFLLTNLLLDRMVGTMRADARAAADAAGLSVAAYAEAAEAAAAADRRDGSVRPRPAPAPLGRVITVGERARLTRRRPAPAAWLQLGRHNYSSWRAREASHQANLLSGLHLADLLGRAAVGAGGATIEMNVVASGGGRWLPRPLRGAFGVQKRAALTALFLASTPLRGLHGLYFDGSMRTREPIAVSRRLGIAPADAGRAAFAVSRALSGAPVAQWEHDLEVANLGGQAVATRRPAWMRGSAPPPPPPARRADDTTAVAGSEALGRERERAQLPLKMLVE